jgi:putative nucleotidyltransferase with HDIG domain
MFYRIKQFLWSITSYFKKVDYDYIDKYLNEKEKELFEKLKKTDKQHSIRVSKDALKYVEEAIEHLEIDKEYLGKLGLLHDIGKVQNPLNSIEKSLIVILHKISKGNIQRYSNYKIVDTYYNHGKTGANILRRLGYDRDFLEAVENHHNEDIRDNKLLEILKFSDNKN